MPGEQTAGILAVEAPFEQRLDQIAVDAAYRNNGGDHQPVDAVERIEEGADQEPSHGEGEEDAAHAALDGFVGRDAFEELGAPDESPHHISPGIAGPQEQKDTQHQLVIVMAKGQEGHVVKQGEWQGDVDEAQHREADVFEGLVAVFVQFYEEEPGADGDEQLQPFEGDDVGSGGCREHIDGGAGEERSEIIALLDFRGSHPVELVQPHQTDKQEEGREVVKPTDQAADDHAGQQYPRDDPLSQILHPDPR